MSAQRRRPAGVLPETLLVAALGCVDLLGTTYLLATGQAAEANPLMRWVMERSGPAGLAAVKGSLIGLPLLVAEAVRPRNRRFVRAALRIAGAVYALMLLAAGAQLLAR